MACQAEFHVPDLDCLRLVVDILIIAEDKNYLTCIEGFPNTYLMLAESKNPNHELHVRAKATWNLLIRFHFIIMLLC